jgi:hypothetical protein
MKCARYSAIPLTVLALLTTGCSDSAAPVRKAEATKPVEAQPISGQSAIFQMFQVARTWSSDAMLLKLENGDIPEAKAQPGKYGVWRATYISQSKSAKREYVYASADSDGGIIKGVRAGADSSYTRSPQTHPFAVQEIRVDTVAAYETAMKAVAADKAMLKVLEENKDLPVQYELEWTGLAPKPQWRVIFGVTVSQSKFSLLIDANNGELVRKIH